ncbi:MAG: protein kinase [Myxococcales bacterium]|nr:protein kinase [Myxococcales bacterium]
MHLEAGAAVTAEIILERPLRDGAMGSVWMARHARHADPVAVKFVAEHKAQDRATLARFRREAEAASALASPHVVKILEFGAASDGTPYLVMELLRGQSLGDRLAAGGRVSLRFATEVLHQVGQALALAHDRGIVHRDIKPDNVFVLQSDPLHVKVLDFGTAKQGVVRDGSIVTATGVAVGTPQYMSPEQVLGQRDVDYRSDLWALAVLVYRMLAGQLPFVAPTPHGLIFQICKGAYTPLGEVGIPEALDPWFARALRTNMEERFTSASEMLTAFDHTLEGVTLGPAIADESTQLIDLAKVARLSAGREAEPSTERRPKLVVNLEETLSVDDEAEGGTHILSDLDRHDAVMRALAMHGDPTGGVDEETTAPGEARRIANNATVPMTHLPEALRQRAASASWGAVTPSPESMAPESTAPESTAPEAPEARPSARWAADSSPVASVPAPRSGVPSTAAVALQSGSPSSREPLPSLPADTPPPRGSARVVVAMVLGAALLAAAAFVLLSSGSGAPTASATPPAAAPAPATDELEEAEDGSVDGENEPAEEDASAAERPPATDGAGRLTVICTPTCDDVRVEGRSFGPSPVYQRELPPGDYDVVLYRDGSFQRIRTTIVPGKESKERVNLVGTGPGTAPKGSTAKASPPAASATPSPPAVTPTTVTPPTGLGPPPTF